MESIEMFTSWENIAKGMSILTAAFTAAISIIPKINMYFSDIRAKSKLKRDLELLKLASETSIETALIQTRVEDSIKFLYRDRKRTSLPLVPHLLAAFLWIGAFAWWTLTIYNESNEFSPWMILTSVMGLMGATALSSPNKESKEGEKKPVFAIYIFSWINAFFNIALSISCAWGGVALLLRSGFTGWHIPIIVGTIGGGYGFFQQFAVKFRKDLESNEG